MMSAQRVMLVTRKHEGLKKLSLNQQIIKLALISSAQPESVFLRFPKTAPFL